MYGMYLSSVISRTESSVSIVRLSGATSRHPRQQNSRYLLRCRLSSFQVNCELNSKMPSIIGNVSEINSHLYLSSIVGQKKEAELSKLGVTLVIDASNLKMKWNRKLKVFEVAIGDNQQAKISKFFHPVADQIAENRRNGGKTVVHCMAGISRSATLVIAYLMREEKMSLTEAFELVKSKRPYVRPNPGFWQQLEELDVQLTQSRLNSAEPINNE